MLHISYRFDCHFPAEKIVRKAGFEPATSGFQNQSSGLTELPPDLEFKFEFEETVRDGMEISRHELRP